MSQQALVDRYPEIFHRPFTERHRGLLITTVVLLYFVFCNALFGITSMLVSANWSIAGAYLADWVSYESRPDIEFSNDDGSTRITSLSIDFPRFDPQGLQSEHSWMTRQGRADSLDQVTITMGTAGRVEVSAERVVLTRGQQSLTIHVLLDEHVEPVGELPAWAEQKRENRKVVAYFGFAGRVEVDDDEVKVRHRFLGWENFLFDTDSPFHGMSWSERFVRLFSSERLDPDRSNLSLAWNNILYNAEWQHLDVWTKLLQTIVMAFVGTLLAVLLAFPLSFLAARNITRNRLINTATKRSFDFLRSVDMLIWALFFTRAFGPGPLAGISAIFFTETGTFGKLYAEALENIDDRQREGVASTGASSVAVQRFGVLPQVLPIFASQALYFWESNTRSATIIGAVGAGGIGLKLWEAMRTNSDWENVFYMVLLILIVVYVFDSFSSRLRKRLTGNANANP